MGSMIRYDKWPEPETSPSAVKAIIYEAARTTKRLGTDLEYNPDLAPTIIGVATHDRCAAAWWSPELGKLVIESGCILVAFAGIGADKPVYEKALGVKTPLSMWDDSMIRHYCVNPDLASVPKGAVGEDEDDPAIALGLMNLWCTTSLLHDVPNWKRCTGETRCLSQGLPCPQHKPREYCAVDSWAGLVDDDSLIEQMADLNIPQSYYEFRRELAEYCEWMHEKGALVDREVIARLEEAITSKKMGLFPYTLSYEGKPYKDGRPRLLKKARKVHTGPFNANSPKAVGAWFREHGLDLVGKGGKPSTGKPVVQKALTKRLKPYGMTFNATLGEIEQVDSEAEDVVLPEVLDVLVRLAQKQCAGKGLSSWFDPKYIGSDNVIHPRFNALGTSMGRMSSSKPNFQNIPNAGFGKEVRKAIVARPGYKIISSDFSQLEFRICLWFAGRDPNEADGAFELLVDKSDGQFEPLAIRLGFVKKDGSPDSRAIAKSLVHGGDYMEGLSLRSQDELNSSAAVGDRKAGALVVYDGLDWPYWTFRGKFVCFTGSNLSERLFGDRRRENRAKALKLQQVYLDAFPEIRSFQMALSTTVEKTSEARLPSGHRLPLYGHALEDNLKQAAAQLGQGGGAIYAQEAMLRFKKLGRVMIIQVHDDLIFEIPQDLDNEGALDFMRPMVLPSEILPGFVCPAKVKVGSSWKDAQEIGTLR